ncbi:uncharacterized protein K02A2.6-like isoform X3 [Amphibalanus amphitrite]|nr:uncharacterized protein K02A2.6-like isoform X3 [Amphibalanus amphitrite]
MLCQLHEGHFGVARMKSFGRMHFWWPGFDQDVERMAAGCRSCQRWRNAAPPTPLHPWEWPRSPWQRLHVDYCGPVNGVMLLVIIDAHSKWMDVHMTRTSSAEVTIEKLRETFACHGVPETVVTDNARYFVCPEFKTFCKRNGVRHVTSPPYSPHSNGLVERAVQTLKQGLQRQSTGSLSTRLSRFLFRYRSMPHSVTQQSPAEMLLGRPMRTQLDLLREDARRSVMEAYQRKQKAQYDVRAQPRIFQTCRCRTTSTGGRWCQMSLRTPLLWTAPLTPSPENPETRLWAVRRRQRPAPSPLRSARTSDDIPRRRRRLRRRGSRLRPLLRRCRVVQRGRGVAQCDSGRGSLILWGRSVVT